MRWLLLAFVAGCWLLQQQAALPTTRGWWIGWGMALLLAMVLLVGWRWPAWWQRLRWVLAIALVVVAAFGWAAWRAEQRMERWLPPELAGRDLVVEGMVAGLPDETERGTRFPFEVAQWRTQAERAPPTERLLLSWRDVPQRLQPGQRYQLTVRLRRPRGLANPHGFDYAYWLLAEGIDATGYVRAATALPDDAAVPWRVRVAMWRAAIRDHLRGALPPDAPYGPVLVALVIGDQRGIPQADWDIFRRTGIAHLVSISGLHITMIAGAAGGLVRWLWRHSLGCGQRWRRPLPLIWPAQKVALVASVATALGYGLIAGMQIPALRTVTMLGVAAVALWSGRAPPVSVVLAWAAGVAVLIDPWAVMSPGFWLSFGAVAVIFFHAAKEEARSGVGHGALDGPDKEADRGGGRVVGRVVGQVVSRPTRAAAAGPSQRWPARLREGLANAARTQWAVTIGLVPLTLLLFGQVSVVSVLANAVAIPVVSLVVTPLALASAVMPATLAAWGLAAAHTVLVWLVGGLSWLAAPSWAVWEAAYPGWLATALALSGVALLLMPGRIYLARWLPWATVGKAGGGKGPSGARSAMDGASGRRAVPRWIGALLMLPMLLAGRAAVAEGEVRVTALDVGQGTAVLVETRRHALLYDAGPAYESGTSAGGQVIVPFLRATGVRGLDMLMVSHEDADHAGGVRDVMRAVPVARRLTAAPRDHPLLAGQDVAPWEACVAGSDWEWDGVRFDILHPSADALSAQRLSSNGRSCVLRVAARGRSVLLTGDIGEREELQLTHRVSPEQLRSDVLLVPHHGSGTSSHVLFLRAVQPQAAIFQLGFANRYRHPRVDVWQRYERAGIARYRSDETGAVSIVTRGVDMQVTPFRQRHRRYWRDAVAAPR